MRLPWRQARALRANGVLGMNQRNGDFISQVNPRRLYPLVDDKVRSKELAQAAGIQVPELYGLLAIQHQVVDLPKLLDGREDFVVKPVNGSGGNGVLVIVGRRKDRYRKASGALLTQDELEHHISNILSGLYSLGGLPDSAMIEYRVRVDPVFEPISHQGVPDLRTVVYRGYPVMAMVRLPTAMSDGKANLHQGAIGAGIDINTGVTGRGVWRNEVVDEHLDTGNPITGVQVPQWDTLLELAARCYDISGLGYLGVDFVLDRQFGPMMLEMNARPGLNVQIANQAGLLPRLATVDALGRADADVAERVAFAKEHFGRASSALAATSAP
ncbi:MAG: alpha-L-glutamate ligase-like protein [Immundisolibacter sp.]|uniref:alpha-L-glutamate ligase-like protein n=1 Tax=Immundisolibacter sp. TaxID=1934948 RepID=UPI003EE2A54E